MAERSKELIQVGYYLSKYGQQAPPMRFKLLNKKRIQYRGLKNNEILFGFN